MGLSSINCGVHGKDLSRRTPQGFVSACRWCSRRTRQNQSCLHHRRRRRTLENMICALSSPKAVYAARNHLGVLISEGGVHDKKPTWAFSLPKAAYAVRNHLSVLVAKCGVRGEKPPQRSRRRMRRTQRETHLGVLVVEGGVYGENPPRRSCHRRWRTCRETTSAFSSLKAAYTARCVLVVVGVGGIFLVVVVSVGVHHGKNLDLCLGDRMQICTFVLSILYLLMS